MRSLVFTTAAAALVLSGCSNAPQGQAVGGSDLFKSGSLGSNVPASCEGGGIATGDEVAVSKEIDIKDAPGKDGKRIINEKSSAIFKRPDYQSVDNSEKLKEVCRQKEWSKIQVLEPNWLTDVTGWVPVSALRKVAHDSSGKRQYVDADFNWSLTPEAKPYKQQIVAAVNRIIRENDRCTSADTGTLDLSEDRSTKGHPTFFITCYSTSTPFNVWFSPDDAVDKGHSFASIRNVNQGDAVLACEQAAKQAANHPQTVDFSEFLDVRFLPYPDGSSRLISSFTAKNSFGVEDKFRIYCQFQGSVLTEREIEKATG